MAPLQVHPADYILADSVQETQAGQDLQSCLVGLELQRRDPDTQHRAQGSQPGDLGSHPGDQGSQFAQEVLEMLLVETVDYTLLQIYFLDEKNPFGCLLPPRSSLATAETRGPGVRPPD